MAYKINNATTGTAVAAAIKKGFSFLPLMYNPNGNENIITDKNRNETKWAIS
jgi:type I site-specific restriction endonuclease